MECQEGNQENLVSRGQEQKKFQEERLGPTISKSTGRTSKLRHELIHKETMTVTKTTAEQQTEQ